MEPLPFNPDEVLSARETFRRLSALRRAAREKAAVYGPTRVYTRADAPQGRALPPLPAKRGKGSIKWSLAAVSYIAAPRSPEAPAMTQEAAEGIAASLRAEATLSTKRESIISERQEARHAREGTKVAALFKIQGGRCYLCAAEFTADLPPTVDHVLPKFHRGKTHRNILLACLPCNNRKANRLPTEDELAYLQWANAELRTFGDPPAPAAPGAGQARKTKAFAQGMDDARACRLAGRLGQV